MKQHEKHAIPADGQASERIADFERLLAAALRRILAESTPATETKQTRINASGRRADPAGEEL